MSLGRVSFNKTQKDGVVFVYGLYQAQVGDGDSLHSFAFRKGDNYGGGMHSWAVAGSDAGGSITKILEDVYNTGKINPCITASKITVDKVKYTVSFYFEIQDSPDGKAYTGFSSWGGAGGSTSAPSDHAYTNYKNEYDAVVKNNPTVTIAIINDFWYPAFFRQVFFQYTRKSFPNLKKGAKSKKGTVGVSINQNSPPKNDSVKVLAYNPTGVQPVTTPALESVVFTETVAETHSEAPSNEAVVEVNAVAAQPVEPPVPRVPDFAPDKIFTFNVEKSQKNSPLSGFWFSPEAGTFSIVPFEPEFEFTGDEDEQLLDDEYYELGFEGSEEEISEVAAIDYNTQVDNAQESEITKRYSDGDDNVTITSIKGGKKWDALSDSQELNAVFLYKTALEYGFNDIEARAMISVVSKESAFAPRPEISYKNTPAKRIRFVFGNNKLAGQTGVKKTFGKGPPDGSTNWSDAEIDSLKSDDKKFWNLLYGSQLGGGPDDGWRYLGRGFNGLTFKGSLADSSGYIGFNDLYKKNGSKAGPIDIVNNPEEVNKKEGGIYKVAAHLCCLYFQKGKNKHFPREDNTNIDKVILNFMRSNAGWRNSTSGDVFQEGWAKAKAFAASLPTKIQ